MKQSWQDIYFPTAHEEAAWEIFHENSKSSQYNVAMTEEQAAAYVPQLTQTLSFEPYPVVKLPEKLAVLDVPLAQVIQQRATSSRLERRPLSLEDLATILYCAYGINRDSEESGVQRSLRTVPSAGALYPLEIFLHTWSVEELPPGLYHYNPLRHELRQLSAGDQTIRIASALVHKYLAVTTSVIFLIGAMFERTIGKYGDRGYRFVLLEAGHLAQNLNLAATGLGLGCINIGGYFDRQIDAMLGFDGLLQSTIYMVGLGGIPEVAAESSVEQP